MGGRLLGVHGRVCVAGWKREDVEGRDLRLAKLLRKLKSRCLVARRALLRHAARDVGDEGIVAADALDVLRLAGRRKLDAAGLEAKCE